MASGGGKRSAGKTPAILNRMKQEAQAKKLAQAKALLRSITEDEDEGERSGAGKKPRGAPPKKKGGSSRGQHAPGATTSAAVQRRRSVRTVRKMQNQTSPILIKAGMRRTLNAGLEASCDKYGLTMGGMPKVERLGRGVVDSFRVLSQQYLINLFRYAALVERASTKNPNGMKTIKGWGSMADVLAVRADPVESKALQQKEKPNLFWVTANDRTVMSRHVRAAIAIMEHVQQESFI